MIPGDKFNTLAKSDMSEEEFFTHVARIYKHLGEKK